MFSIKRKSQYIFEWLTVNMFFWIGLTFRLFDWFLTPVARLGRLTFL